MQCAVCFVKSNSFQELRGSGFAAVLLPVLADSDLQWNVPFVRPLIRRHLAGSVAILPEVFAVQ